MYEATVDYLKIFQVLTDTIKIVSQDEHTKEIAIKQLTEANEQFLQALSFRLSKTY